MGEPDLAELVYLDARLSELAEELHSAVEDTSPEQRGAFAEVFACRDTLYYLWNSVGSVTVGTWPLQPVLDGREEGVEGGLKRLLLSPTYHRLAETDASFDVISQSLAIHSYDSAARELRSILEGVVEAAYIERKLEGKSPRERASTLLEIPDEWRGFGDLLQSLELEASSEIGRLYGDLSSFVHPNYAEFVRQTMEGELGFLETNTYSAEDLHTVTNLVQRTTGAVGYTVLDQFPDATTNFRRKEKVQTFAELLDFELMERSFR